MAYKQALARYFWRIAKEEREKNPERRSWWLLAYPNYCFKLRTEDIHAVYVEYSYPQQWLEENGNRHYDLPLLTRLPAFALGRLTNEAVLLDEEKSKQVLECLLPTDEIALLVLAVELTQE